MKQSALRAMFYVLVLIGFLFWKILLCKQWGTQCETAYASLRVCVKIFSFFRAPLIFDNYKETTTLPILPSLLPHNYCFIDIQLSCNISYLQLGWSVISQWLRMCLALEFHHDEPHPFIKGSATSDLFISYLLEELSHLRISWFVSAALTGQQWAVRWALWVHMS